MQEDEDLFDNVYKVTIFKTMPTKEVTTEYVMASLMRKKSKRKEKKFQYDDAILVSRQGEGNNLFHVKTCNCTTVLLHKTGPNYAFFTTRQ